MEWSGELIVGKEFERPVLPPQAIDNGPLFQHALLCQLGLPRKKVAGPLFERRSGAASLLIEGGPWHTGVDWQMQPIPYGIIPRLAFMYVCREAVRTRSALISIKPTPRAFSRELGLSEGGKAMERFRQQTIALWCCRMHLGFSIAGSQGQVKVEPFEAFRVNADRRGQWPNEVEINQNLLGSLLEYAVALEPAAVRALQSSALALDVYAWLAHRLCRVRERYGVEVSWQSLKDQFGQEYKTIKQFRHDFVAALSRVLLEYPEARVAVIRGGLHLLPSPAPARSSRVCVAALPTSIEASANNEPAMPSVAAASVVPDTVPTAADIPLRPETLSRLATLDPQLDLPRLRASYAKLWFGKWLPDDIDERFVAYAKGYMGRRPEAATTFETIAGQQAELPITASAREEARTLAPGWDISALVREFSRWNRERNVAVKKADKAFLAWVKTYTKGRPPS